MPNHDDINIGISSCLLGEPVRFDSGHKRDAWITATLSRYFRFRPYCPEVAIGLGIPRAPIRLLRIDGQLRVRGVRDPALDVTDRLADFAARTLPELGDLCGYIFKSRSPSCGAFRVKVYSVNGHPDGSAEGAFAAAVKLAMPLLPVEEEGRLGDARLRENFITRVFVYQRWRRLRADGIDAAGLVAFHSDHKYLLMAHNQAAYGRLGQLVAAAGEGDIEARAEDYAAELMAALARPATARGHCNVLSHLLGYLKRDLDAADRGELVDTIEAYRRGELPLIVPITLFNHHFRRHPKPYIERQVYLHPHPRELALRNGI